MAESFRAKEDVIMSKQAIGSVLVVGGGIAGIQASLDLADSGYLVYLVEKNSASNSFNNLCR